MIATAETSDPVVNRDDGHPQGDILRNFRVPAEPKARSRASDLSADAWHSWFHMFRVFRLYHHVANVSVPCRVAAIVRRCAAGSQNPVTDASIAYWAAGVKEAVIRSGLVLPAHLLDVSVEFKKVEGVPLLDRPHVNGTQILIVAA